MPLPKEQHKYTVDDILALPDGQRAELIDGQIYDMGTPTKTHQDIRGYLFFSVQSHIMNNKGSCQAMLAPFSIFLNKCSLIIIDQIPYQLRRLPTIEFSNI